MKDDGFYYVNRTVYNNLSKETLEEEETKEEMIKVPSFGDAPTAKVAVSGHMTKNLGNFESARIGVEVTLPCLACEEDIVNAYGVAQNLVSEMLEEQLAGFDPVKAVR